MKRRLINNNKPYRNALPVNTSSVTPVPGLCFMNCLVNGILAIVSKDTYLETGPGLRGARPKSD